MNNNSFTTTIVVHQTAATAYHAIQHVRGWWSEEIDGPTDQLHQEFFYHYKDIHLCKMRLIEAVPGKKVVYEVTANQFSFIQDPTEWVGTRLVFDITPEGNQTTIQFTHDGLVPAYQCYQVCQDAWTTYIQKSLYLLITTSTGEPNPKDKDGFNAALVEKWKL